MPVRRFVVYLEEGAAQELLERARRNRRWPRDELALILEHAIRALERRARARQARQAARRTPAGAEGGAR